MKILAVSRTKMIKQPKLINLSKKKWRVKFAIWILNNYSKDDTKNDFSQMKSFLTFMAYTIAKIIGAGLPVEKKLIEKIVFIRK